jgi:hypothetical protein
MAGDPVLVLARARLAGLATIEAAEEEEKTEAAAQMVQEAKAVYGIDAEADLCSVRERRRAG